MAQERQSASGRNLAFTDGDSSELRQPQVFKLTAAINSSNLFLLVERQLQSFISTEGREKLNL